MISSENDRVATGYKVSTTDLLIPSDRVLPFAVEESSSSQPAPPTHGILDAVTQINDLLLAPQGHRRLFSGLACTHAQAFGYPLVAIALFEAGSSYAELVGINHAHDLTDLSRRHSLETSGACRFALGEHVKWLQPVLEGLVYHTPRPEEIATPFISQTRARALVRHMRLKSGMVVPLIARGKMVGTIFAGSHRAAPAPGEQSDLIFLAQHTAVAIQMWSLYDRAEGRTALLNKLHTLSQSITSILDLDRLYAEVVSAAGELAKIDFCSVKTLTPDKKWYRNHAAWGEGPRAEVSAELRTIDIFSPDMNRRMLDGEMLLLSSASDFPQVQERLSRRHAQAVAVFPFKFQQETVGFITVGRDEAGKWDAGDVQMLKQLSDYVTVAYTNAQLYTQATRRAERMATLHSTGERLVRIHQPDLLFSALREAVQHTLDAPHFELSLWHGNRNEREIVLDVADRVEREPRILRDWGEGPAEQAIASGGTFHVRDTLALSTQEAVAPDTPETDGPRSILAVPLLSGNRAIGAIAIKSHVPYAYDADDVQTLQVLAAQAAATVENIRLLQAEAQRATEQTALARSVRMIARADVERDEALRAIVEAASILLMNSACSIFLPASEGGLVCAAAYGDNSDIILSTRLEKGDGLTSQVFETGHPVLMPDLSKHPGVVRGGLAERTGVRSFMAVLLRTERERIGVLVACNPAIDLYTPYHLWLLTTLADHATIALSNAHLYSSLQQREAERTTLLHQLLTGQEAERRRIGVDIHDGPLQSIGVHLLTLDRVRKHMRAEKTEKALAELARVRHGMGAVVQELRDVISDLRPALLETQGLVVAAQSHLKSFSEQYNIQVALEDRLDGRRIPPTVEVIFYRLMQEALTNVRKHADATALCVRLYMQGDTVQLSITDNGKGFNPDAIVARALAKGHIGLHSMWERLDVIGGGMEIDSAPGKGTCVTFWAPIA
ncbi:MAG TPA: GAF domain-containing protein [Chloroflexia bacterium]|nr:GAF domain-containing protein [Chloroflexia bacterium]